ENICNEKCRMCVEKSIRGMMNGSKKKINNDNRRKYRMSDKMNGRKIK
ncbi:hypothetical protein HS141_16710, partial [Cetobacterium somerae]|nr:hypothetical protein [Cetobacterium somerae]